MKVFIRSKLDYKGAILKIIKQTVSRELAISGGEMGFWLSKGVVVAAILRAIEFKIIAI